MECCGTCFWHLATGEEWVCNNPECDAYSLETEFVDGKDCPDYEERE